MAYRFDVLLKNGTIVDYASDRLELADVGVKDGLIVEIAPELDPSQSQELLDVSGCHVMPGIIDPHVHASAWLGGRYAHKMMARVGVTTALDMSGPIGSVMEVATGYGVGMNIATIEYVRPGDTVTDAEPSDAELQALVESRLEKGSIGLKLLGGHYPLTPDATARTIAVANRNHAYVAFHAGTAETGSTLTGMLEAIRLADGHALHLAHINSYCRGVVKPYIEETEEAVAALIANPNIRSESYLSPLNGTSAKCSDGKPESLVTQRCLKTGGFEPTEAGMEKAILAGWAEINMEAGGEMVVATGEIARNFWRERGTDAAVSFKVNPAEPRFRLAVAKRPSGQFVVDSISTDGGGIPRNVIVEMGLALVELQALTLKEFVQKSSYNPARVLGLTNKGQLKIGADADITVVDVPARTATLGMVAGQVIMHKGFVCGKGTRLITTVRGAAAVRKQGLEPIVVDLAQSAFYKGFHI